MTPEQTQEFNEYAEMFATDGWKRYVKNTIEHREASLQAAPSGAITNDQWQYCRGMISQQDAVIGFEKFVDAVKEQVILDDEDKEDDDE